MDAQDFWFSAYYTVAMFIAALNSKALGASIVLAIGMLAVYPDSTKAAFIFLFYIPAVIMATFRD